MAIALGTVVFANNTNSSASSITVSVTVAAGDSIYIGAVHSFDDTPTLTCTVSPGAAPTITQIGSDVLDTSGNQTYRHYYVTNPGAGSYTFQYACTPVGSTWMDLFAAPITGGDTTGILVANGPGRFQANPATTTDIVTSGTAQTPSSTPCLVVGYSCDAQCSLTPSVGTGFTDNGDGFGFFGFGAGGRVESKRITSGTAQTTFTVGATSATVVTMMAAFKEAAGGGGVTSTLAATITNDFTVAGTGTHTASSATIATVITNDFTVAGTLSERIPSTVAAVITNDFTVAMAGSGVISGTGAVTITADFTPAAIVTAVDSDMLLDTSGHVVVDGNAAPKFLLLDAAWSLAVMLDRAEVDDYLNTRQAQGFDGVIWELIESGTYGGTANAYGAQPFTVTNDLTTPNEAYWRHIDYIQGALAARGMWSFCNPLYLGIGGGAEGWFSVVGSSEATTYGQWVGARYKDHAHIVWGNYGDYLPSPTTIPTNFRTGLQTNSPSQLILNHLARNSAGTDAGDSPTLNSSYTDADNVFTRVAADWADTPTLATGHYEGVYQGTFGGPTLAAHDVRRQLWHAACAGASYAAGGHHTVWQFLATWDSVIDTDYGATAGYLPALWETIAWDDLEPQSSGVMVTSGEGSGVTYVSAAKTADDKLSVIYLPDGSGSSATVALGQMVSAVRVRWYDPTNGSYQTAGSGTYVGAGNTSFTKPGANAAGDDDWALVLDEVTTITGTLATVITNDFTVAGTLSERNPSTIAVTIASDFTVAGAVTESVPSTIAAVITSDFTVAGTQVVANPVTSTGAVTITTDFTPALTASESIPSTLAAVVTNDFTVAMTGAETVPSTLAAVITSDFTVASTAAETIPSTLAAVITDDFVVAVAGLSSGAGIDGSLSVVIAGDFVVAGTVTETIPSTLTAAIESDFTVAATQSVANPVTSTGAAVITNDFTVAGAGISALASTVAAVITDDFTVAVAGLQAVPVTSTVAAVVTGDFTVAGNVSHSVAGDTTITVNIANDFTVAGTGTEAIPSTLAATDLAASFTVEMVALLEVRFTGTAAIGNDFTVAASGAESIPFAIDAQLGDFIVASNVTATNEVSATIATDIDLAVAIDAYQITPVYGSLALNIAADFGVAIAANSPVPYTSVTVTSFVVTKTPTSRIT